MYVYFAPDLKQQTEQQLDRLSGEKASRTLYRWQDADGQWQVSDRPPPAGTEYEILQYAPETNVIPSENLTGQKKD